MEELNNLKTIRRACLIFTEPHDLEIIIGKDERSGMYSITIKSVGINHNPLIIFDELFSVMVKEEVISGIKNILNEIYIWGQKDLDSNPNSRGNIKNYLLLMRGWKIDETRFLNPEIIDNIINELGRKEVVRYNPTVSVNY